MQHLIRVSVNGRERELSVKSNQTLLEVLRDDLRLKGTREGCSVGVCGSCTVLVDGVPHYSCSMLTHQVRGRTVQTIEGLEEADGTLHPVQQAVVDEQGFQCAFCMPGFVMNMVALVEENPNATRAEAAQYLSGNLCRCADYNKILNVAERAAELSRS